MNTSIFTANSWNNDLYSKLLDYLNKNKDLEYKKFYSGIGISEDNFIGVRTPILKNLALKISKGNYLEFIKLNKHKYYEETLIHGCLIGYIKDDYNKVIKLFNDFIKYIDNWSTCDLTCCNLKIVKKNLDKTYPLILSYLYDDSPWIKRVGVVLLLSHYINDDYIDNIIIECSKIELTDYYVKMSVAWLISMCYIKYPIKTIDFLRFNKIDNWTHNKAIQKIRESLRVSNIEKEKLNYLKR